MEMEMEPKSVAGDNAFAKKGRRLLSRCPNLKNPKSTATAEDAVEQAKGGDGEKGVVKVKLVLTKQELRQIVAPMGRGRGGGGGASLEQLLHVLRRRNMKRSDSGKGQHVGKWMPALQSIPEEISGE